MPTLLDFVHRLKNHNNHIQSWEWLKTSFLLRPLKEFKLKFDHIFFQPQNLCNVLKKGITPLPCKNNLYITSTSFEIALTKSHKAINSAFRINRSFTENKKYN